MKAGDRTHPSPISVRYWYDDIDEGPESEAANSLAAQAAKLSGLKPFPVVAQRVMQMVASPDCNVPALTEVIRNDTAVATRVMRLANSALFRVGQPADSIEQALMRLGTSTIFQLVTAIAVMGLFTGSNQQAIRFRNHCTGVAAVGRSLAHSQRWIGANQVFLCGLMHDLGKLLLLQCGEFDYTDFAEHELQADAAHVRERTVLGYDHAILGAHVLRAWNLPEIVAHTVALHHQPERAYADDMDPTLTQLVAYVRLANRIDHSLQQSAEWTAQVEADLRGGEDAKRAGLTVDVIGGLWLQLAESRKTAQSAFS
jgi:putative nucleotidyltransferase with HDIG domain